jgi:hypothetical protein
MFYITLHSDHKKNNLSQQQQPHTCYPLPNSHSPLAPDTHLSFRLKSGHSDHAPSQPPTKGGGERDSEREIEERLMIPTVPRLDLAAVAVFPTDEARGAREGKEVEEEGGSPASRSGVDEPGWVHPVPVSNGR